MDSIIKKADVLVEALPYIKQFQNKIFIIKCGGSILADEEMRASILEDVTLLNYVGVNPVIVHGGGPAINDSLSLLDKKSEFIDGLRVTDEETMNVVEMVLAGKINKDIVGGLNNKGGRAVGISGKDGGLINSSKLVLPDSDGDLGFVGEVESINPALIDRLITSGYIPVVAPIGSNEKGESFNINADTVAGRMALALEAEKLIFLTDVDGIREQHDEEESRVSSLSIGEAREWIEKKKIQGGMIPKVKACISAVAAGVNRTHILNGLITHALLLEIYTDSGVGTMIKREVN